MGFFSWRTTDPVPSSNVQPIEAKIDHHHSSNVRSVTASSILLRLPPEILQHILSYLQVQSLVALRQTCHELKTHADRDQLWLDLLRLNVPSQDLLIKTSPAASYRELYLSHHPHWHLPRQKIWFSDDAYNGKLILIKFDPRRGSIEGYRLTAEKPPAIPQIWSYKPSVIIHHIEPRVYASTEDPVISIPLSLHHDDASISRRRMSNGSDSDCPFPELRMRVGRPEQRINSSLMLSKVLPPSYADAPSVSVWPPRTIPSMPRIRSSAASGDKFSGSGHKPHTLSEISQTTFRLRTWSHFTQGMLSLGVRIGEEVSSWSTLDTSLYTPTPTKPYQGIFVGDYATHGCEFLLVLQTDAAQPVRRRSGVHTDGGGGDNDVDDVRHRNRLSAMLAALREQQFIDEREEAEMQGTGKGAGHAILHVTSSGDVRPNMEDPDGSIHKGALEAIKLTGDVNVPRGEHTFIADDIGPTGTIRIAEEHPFKGARVVRSRGHVAARGFRHDEFIPSQLFLIGPDTLAQYWLPFGHISYYHRINIDDLLAGVPRERRDSA